MKNSATPRVPQVPTPPPQARKVPLQNYIQSLGPATANMTASEMKVNALKTTGIVLGSSGQ
jgi:hypothetical protein